MASVLQIVPKDEVETHTNITCSSCSLEIPWEEKEDYFTGTNLVCDFCTRFGVQKINKPYIHQYLVYEAKLQNRLRPERWHFSPETRERFDRKIQFNKRVWVSDGDRVWEWRLTNLTFQTTTPWKWVSWLKTFGISGYSLWYSSFLAEGFELGEDGHIVSSEDVRKSLAAN